MTHPNHNVHSLFNKIYLLGIISFSTTPFFWPHIKATDASGDVIANLVTINDMEVAANRSTILSEGFHLLVYEGEDTSGNVASCVLSVSVLGKHPCISQLYSHAN